MTKMLALLVLIVVVVRSGSLWQGLKGYIAVFIMPVLAGILAGLLTGGNKLIVLIAFGAMLVITVRKYLRGGN